MGTVSKGMDEWEKMRGGNSLTCEKRVVFVWVELMGGSGQGTSRPLKMIGGSDGKLLTRWWHTVC